MPSPFPAEIWRAILRLAVQIPGSLETKWNHSPDFLLWHGWEPSWFYMWNSEREREYLSALKTKLSIAQVSRTWREIGVELLYEYLYFPERDISCKQMAAIASIYEQHPNESGYGWATKHIDVPFMTLSPATLPILTRLLNSCHNLRILTISRDNTDPDGPLESGCDASSLSELAFLLQSRFSHSLRRMAFNLSRHNMAAEPAVLPLHLYLPDLPLDSLEIGTNFLSSLEPYSITTVSSLTIHLQYLLSDVMTSWHFPSLRHLHLIDFWDEVIPSLLPFLAFHGPQLFSLAVSPRGFTMLRLSELIPLAPNLRCLVFDLCDANCFSNTDPSLSITHIGIRLTKQRISHSFSSSQFFPKSIFPNLQSLRFLDISDDRPSWLLDIARDFSHVRVENKDRQLIL